MTDAGGQMFHGGPPARRAGACVLLFVVLAAPGAGARAAEGGEGECPPAAWDRAALDALKRAEFALDDDARRDALARALPACLAHRDPLLRDGIAYAALAAWMRAGALAPATVRALQDDLLAQLERPDADGFRAPFAALALAETARTDRISPWMSREERAVVVERAARYLAAVRDYRGYDDVEGWRHGVAHGADWVLQLALNPQLDAPALERLIAAVAVQAVPEAPHAYVFGEPQRLAAVVSYVARRGLRDEAGWSDWFAALLPRLGDGTLAWRDTGWLARRHDLVAFLQAVHAEAALGEDPRQKLLLPGVAAALRAVP